MSSWSQAMACTASFKKSKYLCLDYTVLKKDICKGHYLGLDTLKCSNVLINISVGDFYEIADLMDCYN